MKECAEVVLPGGNNDEDKEKDDPREQHQKEEPHGEGVRDGSKIWYKKKKDVKPWIGDDVG